MVDRQKLEAVLGRRFSTASRREIAAAANAIMGLEDEWEEVADNGDFGFTFSGHCADICAVGRAAEDGEEFKLLRRRHH
jgi:hypothetical protein